MSFIKSYLEAQKTSRRAFLKGTVAAGAVVALPGVLRGALAQDGPTPAWSYRNRTNPYWNTIATGGENFVGSRGNGLEMTHLVYDGSSERMLADVRALLNRTGGNVALAINPNDSPDARAVVEAVAEAGGYVSTLWNKTDDLHPWDFGDNYVSHMTWTEVAPSEEATRVMFDMVGGTGGVVGLGGIPSNQPAIERRQGLMNALEDYPGMELLDYQSADWDTQKANEIMSAFLTRFGDSISCVHCANDSIAFGALEALRAEGLAGEIPIMGFDGTPQAVELVDKGEMTATVFTNPYWGGGITMALAYHAAIGTFTPSAEPREHREFYGPALLVTQDNAAEFLDTYINNTPEYDWTDFWGPTTGPINYD
jgi:ribose transport system substrate-binding protein